MRDIFSFLKLRFRNQFALSQLRDQNKTLQMQAIITVCGYGIAFILMLGYAGGLVYQMQMSSGTSVFYQYLFSLLFWVFGIWTLLSGVKHIFISSDIKQIFVLPIEIWKARLINVFSLLVIQVVISFSVVVISTVCFYMYQPLSFFHIIALFLYTVSTPLLAMVTAIIVSLLIRYLFVCFKIKSAIAESVMLMSIYLLPLLIGYIRGKKIDIKSGFIETTMVKNSFVGEMQFNQLVYALCLFLIAVCVFLFMCLVLVKSYVALASLFVEEVSVKKSKLKVENDMFKLVQKEFAQYKMSFVYVSNTIVGPTGLLLMSFLVLFDLAPKIPYMSFYGFEINYGLVYYCLFLAFVGITTTTACSFSMEGRKIWISRSLPVTFYELSVAKSLVNIILFLPGVVIAIVDCVTVFHLSLNSCFAHVLLLCTHLFTITSLGVYANLKFPKYDWLSEMAIVKQSASVIVMSIVSIALASVIASVVFINDVALIYFVCASELVIVSLLQWHYRKVSFF